MSEHAIGQYRFKSAQACMSEVNASDITLGYRELDATIGNDSDDAESTKFRDVEITCKEAFDMTKDYYMHVKIPASMVYDYDFSIKLVSDSGSKTSYQFLSSEHVNRGSNNDSTKVALYGIPGGMSTGDYDFSHETLSACVIPTWPTRQNGETFKAGVLYYNESARSYYLPTSAEDGKDASSVDLSSIQTNRAAHIELEPSWRYDTDATMLWDVAIVFRPLASGFNKIVLEMTRQAVDYNIVSIDAGQVYYGRTVPLDDVSVKLWKMKDLVKEILPSGDNAPTSLSRIGVWGRPGLLMAINGEEIMIGRRSYFEYDTVPITSLSIAATGFEDNFTVDWMYENTTESGS